MEILSAAAARFEVRGVPPPRRSSADLVFLRTVPPPPHRRSNTKATGGEGASPHRRSNWEGGTPLAHTLGHACTLPDDRPYQLIVLKWVLL